MKSVLFGLVMMTLSSNWAAAQISPGKLHRSHAFLEGVENCTKCHGPDRKLAADRCLSCHATIKDAQQNGKGLHGRSDYRQCQMCHVEHQGRDFDLVYWEGGRDKFDHALTGYRLEGKHATLGCDDCHQSKFVRKLSTSKNEKIDPSRTYLGLDTACSGCHADEHRGQFSAACESCHTQTAWKSAANFDHAKTAFALAGKHAAVPCVKCHKIVPGKPAGGDAEYKLFKPISHANCTDCHADVHNGKFGPTCKGCHNESGWHVTDSASFDHDRTRYPLRGLHAAVACSKCHVPGRPKAGIKFAQCTDCHGDYHRGEFTARPSKGVCDECHTVDGFRPARFEMAKHDETRYPLRGAHRAVPCAACHLFEGQDKQVRFYFKFASIQCQACHKDPHNGEVNELVKSAGCESCHNEDSWGTVEFDHGRTAFALEGKHVALACVKCHDGTKSDRPRRSVTFRGAPKTCEKCHGDVHDGQFAAEGGSTECARCHAPESWRAVSFDHATQARFVLDGAHRDVPCAKCHLVVTDGARRYVKYKPLETTCVSCHDTSRLPEGSKGS